MENDLYRIIQTRKKGRCAEAKKLIPAGTIILHDLPFACVVHNDSHQSDLFKKYSYSSIEQSFLTEARRRGYNDFKAVLLAARVLRRLHRSTSNKPTQLESPHERESISKYQSIESLYDCLNASISHVSTPIYRSNLEASAMMVQRLVHPLSLSLEECKITLQKLSNNAFSITNASLEVVAYGLFLQACVFNHSCRPNALHTFVQDKMVVTAVRDIQAGEEILVSYIDLALPRYSRQAELLQYGFVCDCARCWTADEGLLSCSQCKRSNSVKPVESIGTNKFKQWLDMTALSKFIASSEVECKRFRALGLPYVDEPVDFQCQACNHVLPHAALLVKYRALVKAYDEAEVLLADCYEQSSKSSRKAINRAVVSLKTSVGILHNTYVYCKVFEIILELFSQLSMCADAIEDMHGIADRYLLDYGMYLECKFYCYNMSPCVHPAVVHSYLQYLDLELWFYTEYRYKMPKQRLWRHRKELPGLIAAAEKFYGSGHEYHQRMVRLDIELSQLR